MRKFTASTLKYTHELVPGDVVRFEVDLDDCDDRDWSLAQPLWLIIGVIPDSDRTSTGKPISVYLFPLAVGPTCSVRCPKFQSWTVVLTQS